MLLKNIQSAWLILSRNKVRSFLTMLGIIIGVMSLIMILSVGAGAQSLILNQVKSLGSNLVAVLPGKSDDKGPPASVFGIVVTTLKYDDAKAIMEASIPSIVTMTGYVRGADTVSVGDKKIDTNFLGTSASYVDLEETKPEKGRFFTEEEENTSARVAVLGSVVAKELFGDENPVGAKIKIKRTNFSIIGVMRERGSTGFQNQDNQIFVPLATAQKALLGIDYLSFLRFKIDRAEHIDGAMEAIRSILRDRHDISDPEYDDFSVRSTNQGLEVLTTITDALRFFLAAIAAIALFVGGLGIMNIMLAAVQERTREIGLRKALGATARTITNQFLIETAVITLVGGIIGIIIGVVLSIVVAIVVRRMGYQWDLVISPFSIVFGCVVSIGIGFIFGLLPARRASRLNPIEALQYE